MPSSRPLIVSLLLAAWLLLPHVAAAGEPWRVGFYNVENLYDTINQPSVDDGDFTPEGRMKWTGKKYTAKLHSLAKAIAAFSPDVLGLAEVENYGALSDLARNTDRLHGIVHYDSRDSRGIDLALIYDTVRFLVLNSEPIFVRPMRRNFLRAELCDKRSKERMIVYVVHLPSKLGGGGARTRRSDAHLAIDSLTRIDGPNARIIVMGDFNDSPTKIGRLTNCALAPFRRGQGNYAYRDVWDMIDQIHISPSLLPHTDAEQKVVRSGSLIQTKGRYKGYPRKSTVSDHLPVYLDFR